MKKKKFSYGTKLVLNRNGSHDEIFMKKATFLQMSLVEHLNALLLALASSVDNFTVGLVVGIGRKRLPFWANGLISLINALGALVAGFGGSLILSDLGYATWLSALAFGTLGIQEIAASFSQEETSPQTCYTYDVE